MSTGHAFIMDQKHKDLLLEKTMEIRNSIYLSIDDVTRYLLSKNMLSQGMFQTVSCAPTPFEKVYKLLDLLPLRGPVAFQTFYDALCICELWDAANILKPENASNHGHQVYPRIDQNNVAETCNALLSSPTATSQTQGNARIQMNVNLIFNAVENYKTVLSTGSRNSLQQLDGSSQDSHMAIQQSQDPSQHPPRFQLCLNQQCLKFNVPLNIYDYLTLAAYEQIAELEDRSARDVIMSMSSKATDFIEAKVIELTKGGHMTAEIAKMMYDSKLKPSNPNTNSDCRYFQVWVLFHDVLEGPNILAVNREKIMFLDFIRKNKIIQWWHFNSLKTCRKSENDAFSVILDFEPETRLTLLSLEFEEIDEFFNSEEIRSIRLHHLHNT